MKNFYYKNFLKYLIYYMDEMFFELFLFIYYCKLYLKNLFLKKWPIHTDIYILVLNLIYTNNIYIITIRYIIYE